MKTLIVVSGGDAPGINTAIVRYTQRAQQYGDAVVGAVGGFGGLLSSQFRPIDLPLLRLLEGSGGSYLPSSREPALDRPEAHTRLRRVMTENQIDNILLFGGDGTLRHVLPLLRRWQIPAVALPTTIDNDVAGTERTLGFDTACNFAYASIAGLLATAHALQQRIFTVETLGGDTGYLALDIAFATGAHAVLIPEYDFEVERVADRLRKATVEDRFALAIIGEGVSAARPNLPAELARLAGIRIRSVRLGHAQRGSSASHVDRRLATEMAYLAYDAFRAGVSDGAVIVQKGVTRLYEGTFGTEAKPKPDEELYRVVNG